MKFKTWKFNSKQKKLLEKYMLWKIDLETYHKLFDLNDDNFKIK